MIKPGKMFNGHEYVVEARELGSRGDVISPAVRYTLREYTRVFDRVDTPGSGFHFTCDPDGNILTENEAALENLRKCLDGTYDVIDRGLRIRERTYTDPATIRCHCGNPVVLSTRYEARCEKCGQVYNQSGQRIYHRPYYEDTGETHADVYGPGPGFDDPYW